VDSAWARNRRTTAPAFRELTLKKRARLTRRSPTESEAALARLIKGRRLDVSFERLVPLFRYVVDLCACVLVCLCAPEASVSSRLMEGIAHGGVRSDRSGSDSWSGRGTW
jgi:hypothetical protein